MYYRIRNKQTGQYLQGYRRENDLGRFYRNKQAINAAFAAFKSNLNGPGLLAFQDYLQELEIVPVELTENSPESVHELPTIVATVFPPQPKYEDGGWYEIAGKPHLLRSHWQIDQGWRYNLHLGHVFLNEVGGCWMAGSYNPSKQDIPEADIVVGKQLTTIEHVAALDVVEVYLPKHSNGTVFRPS